MSAVSRVASLGLIALAQVLALSIWFSGTAALPALLAEVDLPPVRQAALTSAVQIGFVAGALISAFTSLADRVDPRRLFAVGALLAAGSNAIALILEPGGWDMVGTRLIAGAALALVYPVGMKLAVSWARGDTGLLVGLLVGALTLGSASPFLFSLFGAVNDWQAPLGFAAVAALVAAALILPVRIGPNFTRASAFSPRDAQLTWRDPGLRLANLGYLGHMWELYAMWAWIGPFLHAYWSRRGGEAGLADLSAFSVIAIGAVACVAAGRIADRYGRTLTCMIAMAVSGSCAILAGFAFDLGPWLLLPLLWIWGMSIIADSAQFSASVAELAPDGRAGTLLTMQTALGFALTAIMVQLLPVWIEFAGWTYAFLPLAIGPALGVWAMWQLRLRPEAQRLAGGRR